MLSFLSKKFKSKNNSSQDKESTVGMNKELLEMQMIPIDKGLAKNVPTNSEERLNRYNSPIGVDPKAMAKAAAARIDAIEQEIALDLRGEAANNIGLHPRASQVASRAGFNRITPPKGVNLPKENDSLSDKATFSAEMNASYTIMPEVSNTLILGDTNFNDVIEVKEITMAPAVEEASILYANGQLDEAINLLLTAFNDKDSLGNSEFNAYRVLFDLLRYKGDSYTFDRYAIDFATRFEKSPPAWELAKPIESTIPVDNIPVLNLGEILDASIIPVLEQLKVIALHNKHIRIDVGNITNINYTDGFGCELLMRVLNAFENTEYQLELIGTQQLFQKLSPFIHSKQAKSTSQF
jgi:tetratricopeptide (TPR) repeat protein